MGLYDRDYYRDDRPSVSPISQWSAVTTLMAVNAAVFFADLFTPQHWIVRHLALEPDLFQHPWNAWQLLTYGFVHSPTDLMHLLVNLLGLWVFGRDVEGIYGRAEFYKLYFSLVILAGLLNSIIQALGAPASYVIGASGGVMGVAVIFACHFPRRVIYLWGVVPVPAVVLVVLFVLVDLLGTRDEGSPVAHWVHLGGTLFGFLYYRTGWNLFRLWPRGWSVRMPRFGPKLRVHREPDEPEPPADDYLTTGRLQKRVDELLEKISVHGESSLTSEERQFLADASRRYQQQRRR